MKKYIRGTIVPKKEPASIFLYFKALAFPLGVSAMQPKVHGNVATK